MELWILLLIVVVAVVCYLLGVAHGARIIANKWAEQDDLLRDFEKPRVVVYVKRNKEEPTENWGDPRIH